MRTKIEHYTAAVDLDQPDVRFGSKADTCAASLVNQLVGAFEHCRWDSQTELFGGLQVDN